MKKRQKNKLDLDKNRLKKVDFFSKKTIFTIPSDNRINKIKTKWKKLKNSIPKLTKFN